jgi:HD-GYP domain-containing protein (c-di-GMP phosphodiesterase class II)
LRVGTQAARIAQRLEDDASLAFLGGATHDIGKLGVPRSIPN